MAKRQRNRVGIELAETAAERGVAPGQEIPNAKIKSVRPRRAIGVWPDAPKPTHGTDKPIYKGTSTWQKPQSDATSQMGDDLTSAK
jgi:hypothetical protein